MQMFQIGQMLYVDVYIDTRLHFAHMHRCRPVDRRAYHFYSLSMVVPSSNANHGMHPLSYIEGTVALGSMIVAICQFIIAVLTYIEKKAEAAGAGDSLAGYVLKACKCCMLCLDRWVLLFFFSSFLLLPPPPPSRTLS